jgi:hypothetical protein
MEKGNRISWLSSLGRVLAVFFSAPWIEVFAEAWKIIHKIWSGLAEEGIYEVLEHESTLELKDVQGEKALVRKRQKVRYLQNNIMAYQDQAWGDGEILLNYKCAPGTPVDQYRPGQKTYILISLREMKSKGDIDEFNIEWGIREGFLRSTELWAAEVSHRTRRLKLQVIFPKDRAPINISLNEELAQTRMPLGEGCRKQLPDGRWAVTWETDHPRLYESYAIKWEW